MTTIPRTHFSVLQELTYGLIAPMEVDGYTLPDYLVPTFRRAGCSPNGFERRRASTRSSFPTYKHKYEDGRVVETRLYPNELTADFRAHFNEVWLPTSVRCISQKGT